MLQGICIQKPFVLSSTGTHSQLSCIYVIMVGRYGKRSLLLWVLSKQHIRLKSMVWFTVNTYTYIYLYQVTWCICTSLWCSSIKNLLKSSEVCSVESRTQVLNVPNVLHDHKTVCLNETWRNLHSRRWL